MPEKKSKKKDGGEEGGEHNIHALLGQPAVVQLVDMGLQGKSDADKKEVIKKIATQCASVDGKGKLTVDDFYNVVKVQCKVDVSKTDIRKVVADLPMDKNYKVTIEDFCRTPILSDDVFKAMDKNNDGQISKGELKLARKNLTMKQIESIIKKLDKDGDGTISLEEVKKGQ